MAEKKTIKRVTRKRSTAPKTARKPRLSEEAAAELAGVAVVEEIAAPAVKVAVDVAPDAAEVAIVDAIVEPPVAEVAPVEVLEVVPPVTDAAAESEIKVVEAPPPPRAVSVWPPEVTTRVEPTRAERRFRRVAFVRAMLHRLRRAAEARSAPLVRRVAARFPRLVALRDSIRRWL